MSIYGGFGTRVQETNYNKAIYNLLYLMQLKISRNSKNRKNRPSHYVNSSLRRPQIPADLHQAL